MGREVLLLPSSDYDFERVSRRDRVFAVLEKNSQEPVLEIVGDVAYRIWLCLRAQQYVDFLRFINDEHDYLERSDYDPMIDFYYRVNSRQEEGLSFLENWKNFGWNSSCHGASMFVSGKYSYKELKEMGCVHSQRSLSLNAVDLRNEEINFPVEKVVWGDKDEEPCFDDLKPFSTVLISCTDLSYIHSFTFLGASKIGDSLVFHKSGYDNGSFQILDLEKIDLKPDRNEHIPL